MTLTFHEVETWLNCHPAETEEYFVRNATSHMVRRWLKERASDGDILCVCGKSEFDSKTERILSKSINYKSEGDVQPGSKVKLFRFSNTVDVINPEEQAEIQNEKSSEFGQNLSVATRRHSGPQQHPVTKRQYSFEERKRELTYSRTAVSSRIVDSLNLSEIREEHTRRVRSPQRPLRKTKSLPNCGKQHVLGALIESKIRLPSPKGMNNESKVDLKNTNEREFFFEIVKDIANDLDVRTLSYKILVNVGILTNADRCSLFLVEGSKGKRKWLVSKVFDVHVNSPSSPSKDFMDHQREIRVPWGKGLVGYAAETGETVNIPDAYAVGSFLSINKSLGFLGVSKSLVCCLDALPIKCCMKIKED